MQEWAAQMPWQRPQGDLPARSSAAQLATAPAEMTAKRGGKQDDQQPCISERHAYTRHTTEARTVSFIRV
jgi:hypothetical protein